MRPPGPDPRTARAALQDAQRAHGRGLAPLELNANKEKRMARIILDHPDTHAAILNARLTADDWHQMRTNSAEYFKEKFGGENPAPEAAQATRPAIEVPALPKANATPDVGGEAIVNSAAPNGQASDFSETEIDEAWAAVLSPYQAGSSATPPANGQYQSVTNDGPSEDEVDAVWAAAIAKVNAPRAAG